MDFKHINVYMLLGFAILFLTDPLTTKISFFWSVIGLIIGAFFLVWGLVKYFKDKKKDNDLW